MLAFWFGILTGISVLYIAFLWHNLLISLKTSSTLPFEKLKLCGLNAFLIAVTFGWLRNFIIAFKAGWEIYYAEKSMSLNSGIFRCFITLKNNEFNILSFSSSLVIILSSCTNVIFSEDFTLFEKRGFTVFRNLLLHITFFSFTFS